LHLGTILRNIFSNSAAYLVTAVIGFLLAPFVVHSLGNTGYGLWTLVLSFTGYFGLLDLGIRSSVGRFVARYLALDDHINVNRIVSTAFAMLTSGSVLALIVTAIAVRYFFSAFKIEPEFQDAARTALLITGVNMACVLPLGVFTSILIALDRFDVISAVTIVGEVTRAALVVVFLRRGDGLIAIALIALCVTAAQYGALAFCVNRLYRPLHFSVRLVDVSTFKELFCFSIFRFIWIVANQLIFYSASVVIGIFLTAAAITYFAIASSVVNYGRQIVSLVTDTFAPSATRMDAKGDLAGLQRLLIFGTRISLLISLPLCVGFLFLGKQFIVLWMGPAFAASAGFLAILTIPQFTSMSQYMSVLILAGMAKHRVLAYIALAEGVTNVILSIILVQKMGLAGVAWGTAIPGVIATAIIVPLYTLRTLNLSVREYVVGAYLRPLICAVPAAALAFLFSRLVVNPTWAIFAAEVIAIAAVFGLLGCFLCFDSAQRAAAIDKVSSVFERERVIHET
jgi:O-antigen/teichoic acid export membrane protein